MDNSRLTSIPRRLPNGEYKSMFEDSLNNYSGVPLSPSLINSILNDAFDGTSQEQASLFKTIIEREPIIAAHLQSRMLAVLGLHWKIQSDNQAKANEVQKIFENADLYGLMNHLLFAIPYGYSGSFIEWGRGGGTINAFPPIDVTKFEFDEYGDVYITNTENELVKLNEEYDANQTVFHTYNVKSGIPSTTGLMRTLVWIYFFKNFAMKHKARFLEQYGIPFLITKITDQDFANEATRSEIKNALRRIGADGMGVVTQSTEVQTIGTQSGGENANFQTWIEYLDKIITVTILGQLASSDKATGMSNGQVQDNVRRDIIEADAYALERTINTQVLRPLEWFKYRTQELMFKIDYEPKEDLKSKADLYSKFKSMGYEFDTDELTREFGMKLKKKGADDEQKGADIASAMGGQEQPAMPPMNDGTSGTAFADDNEDNIRTAEELSPGAYKPNHPYMGKVEDVTPEDAEYIRSQNKTFEEQFQDAYKEFKNKYRDLADLPYDYRKLFEWKGSLEPEEDGYLFPAYRKPGHPRYYTNNDPMVSGPEKYSAVPKEGFVDPLGNYVKKKSESDEQQVETEGVEPQDETQVSPQDTSGDAQVAEATMEVIKKSESQLRMVLEERAQKQIITIDTVDDAIIALESNGFDFPEDYFTVQYKSDLAIEYNKVQKADDDPVVMQDEQIMSNAVAEPERPNIKAENEKLLTETNIPEDQVKEPEEGTNGFTGFIKGLWDAAKEAASYSSAPALILKGVQSVMDSKPLTPKDKLISSLKNDDTLSQDEKLKIANRYDLMNIIYKRLAANNTNSEIISYIRYASPELLEVFDINTIIGFIKQARKDAMGDIGLPVKNDLYDSTSNELFAITQNMTKLYTKENNHAWEAAKDSSDPILAHKIAMEIVNSDSDIRDPYEWYQWARGKESELHDKVAKYASDNGKPIDKEKLANDYIARKRYANKLAIKAEELINRNAAKIAEQTGVPVDEIRSKLHVRMRMMLQNLTNRAAELDTQSNTERWKKELEDAKEKGYFNTAELLVGQFADAAWSRLKDGTKGVVDAFHNISDTSTAKTFGYKDYQDLENDNTANIFKKLGIGAVEYLDTSRFTSGKKGMLEKELDDINKIIDNYPTDSKKYQQLSDARDELKATLFAMSLNADDVTKMMTQTSERYYDQAHKMTFDTGNKVLDYTANSALSAVEMAPPMIASSLLSLAGPAGDVISTTMWTTITYDDMYNDMVDSGVSEETARSYSSAMALPVALVENLQMAKRTKTFNYVADIAKNMTNKHLLTKSLTKTAFRKLMFEGAKDFAMENFEEAVQDAMQLTTKHYAMDYDNMGYDQKKDWMNYLSQRLDTAVSLAFIRVGFGGMGMVKGVANAITETKNTAKLKEYYTDLASELEKKEKSGVLTDSEKHVLTIINENIDEPAKITEHLNKNIIFNQKEENILRDAFGIKDTSKLSDADKIKYKDILEIGYGKIYEEQRGHVSGIDYKEDLQGSEKLNAIGQAHNLENAFRNIRSKDAINASIIESQNKINEIEKKLSTADDTKYKDALQKAIEVEKANIDRSKKELVYYYKLIDYMKQAGSSEPLMPNANGIKLDYQRFTYLQAIKNQQDIDKKTFSQEKIKTEKQREEISGKLTNDILNKFSNAREAYKDGELEVVLVDKFNKKQIYEEYKKHLNSIEDLDAGGNIIRIDKVDQDGVVIDSRHVIFLKVNELKSYEDVLDVFGHEDFAHRFIFDSANVTAKERQKIVDFAVKEAEKEKKRVNAELAKAKTNEEKAKILRESWWNDEREQHYRDDYKETLDEKLVNDFVNEEKVAFFIQGGVFRELTQKKTGFKGIINKIKEYINRLRNSGVPISDDVDGYQLLEDVFKRYIQNNKKSKSKRIQKTGENFDKNIDSLELENKRNADPNQTFDAPPGRDKIVRHSLDQNAYMRQHLIAANLLAETVGIPVEPVTETMNHADERYTILQEEAQKAVKSTGIWQGASFNGVQHTLQYDDNTHKYILETTTPLGVKLWTKEFSFMSNAIMSLPLNTATIPANDHNLADNVGVVDDAVYTMLENIVPDFGKYNENETLGYIHVVPTFETLPERLRNEHEGQEAFYDPITAKSYIVAELLVKSHNSTANMMSLSDYAKLRAMQQIVSQEGLKAVLGDKYETFMDSVLNDHKEEIIKSKSFNQLNLSPVRQRDLRMGAELLIADLAINDVESTWMSKIISTVNGFLRDSGLNIPVSNKEIADVVSKSLSYITAHTSVRHSRYNEQLEALKHEAMEYVKKEDYESAKEVFKQYQYLNNVRTIKFSYTDDKAEQSIDYELQDRGYGTGIYATGFKDTQNIVDQVLSKDGVIRIGNNLVKSSEIHLYMANPVWNYIAARLTTSNQELLLQKLVDMRDGKYDEVYKTQTSDMRKILDNIKTATGDDFAIYLNIAIRQFTETVPYKIPASGFMANISRNSKIYGIDEKLPADVSDILLGATTLRNFFNESKRQGLYEFHINRMLFKAGIVGAKIDDDYKGVVIYNSNLFTFPMTVNPSPVNAKVLMHTPNIARMEQQAVLAGATDLTIDDIIELELANDEQGAIAFKEKLAHGEYAKRDLVNAAIKEWNTKGYESRFFQRWFRDSEIIDIDGTPKVVYHGSEFDFDVFNTTSSEFGAHFGEKEVSDQFQGTDGAMVAGYLRIENPIRLEDKLNFNPSTVLNQIQTKYGLGKDLVLSGDYEADTKMLHEYLISKGYDGVVYVNLGEYNIPRSMINDDVFDQFMQDKLHMDGEELLKKYDFLTESYIIFKPEQFKLIDNYGTFSEVSSMRFSVGNEISSQYLTTEKLDEIGILPMDDGTFEYEYTDLGTHKLYPLELDMMASGVVTVRSRYERATKKLKKALNRIQELKDTAQAFINSNNHMARNANTGYDVQYYKEGANTYLDLIQKNKYRLAEIYDEIRTMEHQVERQQSLMNAMYEDLVKQSVNDLAKINQDVPHQLFRFLESNMVQGEFDFDAIYENPLEATVRTKDANYNLVRFSIDRENPIEPIDCIYATTKSKMYGKYNPVLNKTEEFDTAKSSGLVGIQMMKQIISQVVPKKFYKTIKDYFKGRNVKLLPIYSQNMNVSTNLTPVAFALDISDKTGIPVDMSIKLHDKAGVKRGSSVTDRIATNTVWKGKVDPKTEYIIVDNYISTGGTVADLADYIRSNGGKVTTTLAMAGDPTNIQANDIVLERLYNKYGKENIEAVLAKYNSSIDRLTQGEIVKLTNVFSSIEEIDEALAEALDYKTNKNKGQLPKITPKIIREFYFAKDIASLSDKARHAYITERVASMKFSTSVDVYTANKGETIIPIDELYVANSTNDQFIHTLPSSHIGLCIEWFDINNNHLTTNIYAIGKKDGELKLNIIPPASAKGYRVVSVDGSTIRPKLYESFKQSLPEDREFKEFDKVATPMLGTVIHYEENKPVAITMVQANSQLYNEIPIMSQRLPDSNMVSVNLNEESKVILSELKFLNDYNNVLLYANGQLRSIKGFGQQHNQDPLKSWHLKNTVDSLPEAIKLKAMKKMLTDEGFAWKDGKYRKDGHPYAYTVYLSNKHDDKAWFSKTENGKWVTGGDVLGFGKNIANNKFNEGVLKLYNTALTMFGKDVLEKFVTDANESQKIQQQWKDEYEALKANSQNIANTKLEEITHQIVTSDKVMKVNSQKDHPYISRKQLKETGDVYVTTKWTPWVGKKTTVLNSGYDYKTVNVTKIPTGQLILPEIDINSIETDPAKQLTYRFAGAQRITLNEVKKNLTVDGKQELVSFAETGKYNMAMMDFSVPRAFIFDLKQKPKYIFVAEGYATGSVIHEAMLEHYGRENVMTVCGMTANQMANMIPALREKFGYEPELVICADNDKSLTGERLAKEPFEKGLIDFVNTRIVMPNLDALVDADGNKISYTAKQSDFNDLLDIAGNRDEGISLVKEMIAGGRGIEVKPHEQTILRRDNQIKEDLENAMNEVQSNVSQQTMEKMDEIKKVEKKIEAVEAVQGPTKATLDLANEVERTKNKLYNIQQSTNNIRDEIEAKKPIKQYNDLSITLKAIKYLYDQMFDDVKKVTTKTAIAELQVHIDFLIDTHELVTGEMIRDFLESYHQIYKNEIEQDINYDLRGKYDDRMQYAIKQANGIADTMNNVKQEVVNDVVKNASDEIDEDLVDATDDYFAPNEPGITPDITPTTKSATGEGTVIVDTATLKEVNKPEPKTEIKDGMIIVEPEGTTQVTKEVIATIEKSSREAADSKFTKIMSDCTEEDVNATAGDIDNPVWKYLVARERQDEKGATEIYNEMSDKQKKFTDRLWDFYNADMKDDDYFARYSDAVKTLYNYEIGKQDNYFHRRLKDEYLEQGTMSFLEEIQRALLPISSNRRKINMAALSPEQLASYLEKMETNTVKLLHNYLIEVYKTIHLEEAVNTQLEKIDIQVDGWTKSLEETFQETEEEFVELTINEANEIGLDKEDAENQVTETDLQPGEQVTLKFTTDKVKQAKLDSLLGAVEKLTKELNDMVAGSGLMSVGSLELDPEKVSNFYQFFNVHVNNPEVWKVLLDTGWDSTGVKIKINNIVQMMNKAGVDIHFDTDHRMLQNNYDMLVSGVHTDDKVSNSAINNWILKHMQSFVQPDVFFELYDGERVGQFGPNSRRFLMFMKAQATIMHEYANDYRRLTKSCKDRKIKFNKKSSRIMYWIFDTMSLKDLTASSANAEYLIERFKVDISNNDVLSEVPHEQLVRYVSLAREIAPNFFNKAKYIAKSDKASFADKTEWQLIKEQMKHDSEMGQKVEGKYIDNDERKIYSSENFWDHLEAVNMRYYKEVYFSPLIKSTQALKEHFKNTNRENLAKFWEQYISYGIKGTEHLWDQKLETFIEKSGYVQKEIQDSSGNKYTAYLPTYGKRVAASALMGGVIGAHIGQFLGKPVGKLNRLGYFTGLTGMSLGALLGAGVGGSIGMFTYNKEIWRHFQTGIRKLQQVRVNYRILGNQRWALHTQGKSSSLIYQYGLIEGMRSQILMIPRFIKTIVTKDSVVKDEAKMIQNIKHNLFLEKNGQSGDFIEFYHEAESRMTQRAWRTYINKIFDYPSNQLEIALDSLAAESAINYYKRLGYTSEEDLELAAYIGVTRSQSIYNKEGRATSLNSDIVRLLRPHQSYHFTLFGAIMKQLDNPNQGWRVANIAGLLSMMTLTDTMFTIGWNGFLIWMLSCFFPHDDEDDEVYKKLAKKLLESPKHQFEDHFWTNPTNGVEPKQVYKFYGKQFLNSVVNVASSPVPLFNGTADKIIRGTFDIPDPAEWSEKSTYDYYVNKAPLWTLTAKGLEAFGTPEYFDALKLAEAFKSGNKKFILAELTKYIMAFGNLHSAATAKNVAETLWDVTENDGWVMSNTSQRDPDKPLKPKYRLDNLFAIMQSFIFGENATTPALNYFMTMNQSNHKERMFLDPYVTEKQDKQNREYLDWVEKQSQEDSNYSYDDLWEIYKEK